MLIRSAKLSALGVRHGFSTREGGVSAPPFDALNLARNVGDDARALAENHARLAAAVGYSIEALAEASQVHGVRCLDVDALASEGRLDAERVRVEQADALMTSVAGRAVGVRTADCVPILVVDPRSCVVAAIHAGWRGAVDGVVPRALGALSAAHRCDLAELVVAIGPHIRCTSFEVGDEVVEACERAMPRGDAGARAIEIAGALIERPAGAKAHASLATLVVAQLLDAGVHGDHVEDVGGDTYAERTRFHSHRRDGAASGRMLSVIVAG